MTKLLIGGMAAFAAITFAPLAHANDNGDQASAAEAVTAIYNQVQKRCTPSMSPNLQSISWSSFYPASWGEGVIHDANSSLGGSFRVNWFNPRVGQATDGAAGRAYHGPNGNTQWAVDLQFC